jgi:hypothetical protein
MKQIYDIFGSVTLIHTKYANLQLYVIKRLHSILTSNDAFSSDSGGKQMTYQRQYWTDSLPSDPEIVSSIFCHLLDAAYYGSVPRSDYRSTINHLINSSQVSCIHYLSDE